MARCEVMLNNKDNTVMLAGEGIERQFRHQGSPESSPLRELPGEMD